MENEEHEQSVSFTELPAALGPSRAALQPRGHSLGHGRAGRCQYCGHAGFMRALKSPVAIQGLWSHTQIILHIPAHSMALLRIKAIKKKVNSSNTSILNTVTFTATVAAASTHREVGSRRHCPCHHLSARALLEDSSLLGPCQPALPSTTEWLINQHYFLAHGSGG